MEAVAVPSPRTIPNRGDAELRSLPASRSTASRRTCASATPRRRASLSSTARSSLSAATVVRLIATHQMLASTASAAGRRRGSGLVGLTDRVEARGGTMTIVSPTGAGTWARVELPADVDAAAPSS
jgi:hypothetical protein